VRLIKDRGVSYVQASEALGVHTSQLRDWVKKFADDPEHAFPGHGQMKPEPLEIARLKREVIKLKAERDILKKPRPTSQRAPAGRGNVELLAFPFQPRLLLAIR
jgi:transposase-like protein